MASEARWPSETRVAALDAAAAISRQAPETPAALSFADRVLPRITTLLRYVRSNQLYAQMPKSFT